MESARPEASGGSRRDQDSVRNQLADLINRRRSADLIGHEEKVLSVRALRRRDEIQSLGTKVARCSEVCEVPFVEGDAEVPVDPEARDRNGLRIGDVEDDDPAESLKPLAS